VILEIVREGIFQGDTDSLEVNGGNGVEEAFKRFYSSLG
jgi:hypothetical protein